jgi:hypothetical protein
MLALLNVDISTQGRSIERPYNEIAAVLAQNAKINSNFLFIFLDLKNYFTAI